MEPRVLFRKPVFILEEIAKNKNTSTYQLARCRKFTPSYVDKMVKRLEVAGLVIKNKSTNPDVVYKELMKYKSFRNSTPRTREDKLRRAIQRRK